MQRAPDPRGAQRRFGRRLLFWLATCVTSTELAAQTLPEDLSTTTRGTADCTVRLNGGRRVTDLGDREHYAALTVTAPWDGCFPWGSTAPRSEEANRAQLPNDDVWRDARPDERSPLDPGEELELEEWHDLDLEGAPLLAKTDDEVTPPGFHPPVLHVVTPRLAKAVAEAALRAAGYQTMGRSLRAAKSRARWSAALPDVRLRAARGIDETARVDYAGEVVGDTRLTGRADVRLEAAFTWRLSELVFSGREPTLARIELTLLRQRQEVTRTTLQALFRWQKAQNALADPAALPEERAKALLESVEAEVSLAVLTGGWFSTERVAGAPWMAARAAETPPATARSTRRKPQPAPAGTKPKKRTRGAAISSAGSGSQASAGPNAPGESAPVGVNEPRDAFRDAKQVD